MRHSAAVSHDGNLPSRDLWSALGRKNGGPATQSAGLDDKLYRKERELAHLPVVLGLLNWACSIGPAVLGLITQVFWLAAAAVSAQRDETVTNVDMNMVHIAIGHGTARVVVGDQPLHDGSLTARSAEIDGHAVAMLGGLTRRGNGCSSAASRDDANRTKSRFNPIEQRAC